MLLYYANQQFDQRCRRNARFTEIIKLKVGLIKTDDKEKSIRALFKLYIKSYFDLDPVLLRDYNLTFLYIPCFYHSASSLRF